MSESPLSLQSAPARARSRRRRPLLALALTTTVAAALTLAPTAGATADTPADTHASPTRQARSAGVTPGNATMGWSEPAAPRSVSAAVATPSGVNGIDVSRWQGTVDWAYWKKHGKTFAYVKATEGTYSRNPYFSSQYTGSYRAGLVRGAYHFANPRDSTGTTQANFFVAHGGGWRSDGHTLPGVLDIEYNPYGSTCYGLSRSAMVSWIRAFTGRYKQLTHRDAVIYTTTDWWRQCTGNSTAFSRTSPLWIARYASAAGTLPGGWTRYTFWQYSGTSTDLDHFSSDRTRLVAFARG